MFHKEGHSIIVIFLTAVIGDILLLEYFLDDGFLKIFLQIVSLTFLILHVPALTLRYSIPSIGESDPRGLKLTT